MFNGFEAQLKSAQAYEPYSALHRSDIEWCREAEGKIDSIHDYSPILNLFKMFRMSLRR